MTLEQVLLQTCQLPSSGAAAVKKCDIHLLTNPCGQVDHPYSAILKYTKCLKGNKAKSQVRKLRRGKEHMASGWCLCNNAGAEQCLVSMVLVLVVDHHWWCW